MNKDYYSKYLKYKMKYLREKENLRGGERGNKIVLFAISANPPTLSHIKIVQQLSTNYNHVVVWTSTNPNKQNPKHKDYDPHYLTLPERVTMFRSCVEDLGLKNVVFDQDYSDLYSGISICNYIEKNLTKIHNLGDIIRGVRLKQFTTIDRPKDDKLVSGEKYELWICFGKDVVADTPNWTYNNLFLTLATGIVMIDRKDNTDYSDDRYKLFSDSYAASRNSRYFTMPCIKGKANVKEATPAIPKTATSKEIPASEAIPATRENIIEYLKSINKGCYDNNNAVVPIGIGPYIPGPSCIVEKKTLSELGNTSSSKVRNYMMYYHLTNEEEKGKILAKLQDMVPDSVLGLMTKSRLYNIPTEEREREKKIKILKNLGLLEDATDEQIKEKIRIKESEMLS
jgi:nicotinic acid mononucleotide adenylyltransferase